MLGFGTPFAMGADLRLPRPSIATHEPTVEHRAAERVRLAHTKLMIAPDSRPVLAASFVPGDVKLARQFDRAGNAAAHDAEQRFDAMRDKAGLTSEKLANLFRHSGKKSARPVQAAEVPALERFGRTPADIQRAQGVMLAYATPDQDGGALSAFSHLLMENEIAEEELAALPDDAAPGSDDETGVYDETPDDGPLPQLRPARQFPLKPMGAAKQIEPQDDEEEAEKPAVRPTAKPRSLALARPEQPERGEGVGQSLRNLFGGTKAGNGVAVYDISAAKVYMPDGTVLEAHSGIGKMADNPRYVHVKMGGATPPHVYNLKMRERRFHGVEAIRMLPIDGKNKYGRDGFLTHSYLLRSGRAESHGCVAFKDYNKFLNAYKQGKIRQIAVVSSGGRAAGIRMASKD